MSLNSNLVKSLLQKFSSSKEAKPVPQFVKNALNLVVPTVLFNLLSPGNLLTIPPTKMRLLFSGMTSRTAIAVHTVVFALVYSFLRTKYSNLY